jgi:hypothetical protein
LQQALGISGSLNLLPPLSLPKHRINRSNKTTI